MVITDPDAYEAEPDRQPGDGIGANLARAIKLPFPCYLAEVDACARDHDDQLPENSAAGMQGVFVLVRRFHRPTGLDDKQSVRLCLGFNRRPIKITIGGRQLAWEGLEGAIEVGGILGTFNELRVVFRRQQEPTGTDNAVGEDDRSLPLLRFARLEIDD